MGAGLGLSVGDPEGDAVGESVGLFVGGSVFFPFLLFCEYLKK